MQTIDRQLIEACKNDDTLTVEQLLQQGANPNAKDNRWPYLTALIIATQHGHIPIIKRLIQHGANPHATDQYGKTALHYAVEKQYRNIAQYLLTELQLNPNIQDPRGTTPFMIAAQNGDIDMLQFLIQHGANPYATDRYGKTALNYALAKQHHDIVQYLITQLQLDPNLQDQWGKTPLFSTTINGDFHMLKHLIQLGANPTTIDHQGRSALHYALEYRHHDIAQYLLTELQLDPNIQDNDGITPFLIATKKHDIKILRLLIQLGANPYVTDKHGRTALHYAVKYYHYNVLKYLITHLHPDPNAQDHNGNTPLLIAIHYRDQRIANTLIQLGANPYIPNHQGQTPAAIARRRKIPLPKPQPSTITL